MASRKKIAIAVFVTGVLASLLYVPMEICGPLGFRGTFRAETRCNFQGYFPLLTRPTTPHNDTNQIRIAHSRVGITWAVLLVFCILLGTDYSNKSRS